jgi:ATP-dependent Clp protease ATP-binding subunit ClpA
MPGIFRRTEVSEGIPVPQWSTRGMTDCAQGILVQIPARIAARGHRNVDGQAILAVAFWSLLLWERKIGLVALERSGVDRFDLARALDLLLQELESTPHADAREKSREDDIQSVANFDDQAFEELLEPLLVDALRQAKELEHSYIGSEHLLLAVINLAQGQFKECLRQHDVSRNRIAAEVIRLLQPQVRGSEPPR